MTPGHYSEFWFFSTHFDKKLTQSQCYIYSRAFILFFYPFKNGLEEIQQFYLDLEHCTEIYLTHVASRMWKSCSRYTSIQINSVQIWEELSVNSRNVQYWPVSTSFPHLDTPSKQWLTWNLMVRISQNTLQQFPALYYWIQLITYHFLKVNFEQVLDALLNSSGVWLKPPYSLFLSAVNSFRFLRILSFSCWLSSITFSQKN